MSRCPNCESPRILVVLGPKPRASCRACGCRWIQQGREQIAVRLPGEGSRNTHPSNPRPGGGATTSTSG
ncbi:MAG TPA: hypothetical protein VID47_02320 [Actinomycetota bacterium]|jgi:hypothetical protein